jgi:hypothetical protein
MEEMKPYYTYKQGRSCLKCKKPIPDQIHALRKYCANKRLPDGTVDSCKDDYHSPIRKRKNEPFQKMAAFQKAMYERIDRLFNAKGEIVTEEFLNRWGIVLQRPFEFNTKDGKYIFYYHQYSIKELGNKQFKISKHDRF